MFFSVIGWLIVAVILGKLSLAYLLVMFNGLGQYNIGGVPNSTKKKLVIVAGMFLFFYLWYTLFQHSPFSVSISG
jgi:hypothetical protein